MLFTVIAVLLVTWLLLRYFLGRPKPGYVSLPRLAGSDSWMLAADSPTNSIVINAMVFLEANEEHPDPVSIDMVRDAMRERAVKLYPRLTQRVVYANGQPCWEPMGEHFRLEQHVELFDSDDPHRVMRQADLQRWLSSIWDKPLDPTRPMWHWLLIPNYVDEDGQRVSAILGRIHHSYADGLSMMRFVLSTMDDSKQQQQQPQTSSEAKRTPEAARASFERNRSLSVNMKRVGLKRNSTLTVAVQALMYPWQLLRKFIKPADRSILHGPPLSGRRRVAWSGALALNRIKTIKNSLGVKLNDVLMACMSLALRQVIQKHNGGAPVENVWANVPISLHKQVRPGEMSNKFSLIQMELATGEDDPLMCLQQVGETMDALKRSIEPIGNFFTISLLSLFPDPIVNFIVTYLASKTSVTLSNVPGPSTHVTYMGRRVKDLLFFVPSLGSIGVGLGILSYDGRVRVGVSVDEALIDDPEPILKGFVDNLDELERLAHNQKKTK